MVLISAARLRGTCDLPHWVILRYAFFVSTTYSILYFCCYAGRKAENKKPSNIK